MIERVDMGVRVAGQEAVKEDEFVTKSQCVHNSNQFEFKTDGNGYTIKPIYVNTSFVVEFTTTSSKFYQFIFNYTNYPYLSSNKMYSIQIWYKINEYGGTTYWKNLSIDDEDVFDYVRQQFSSYAFVFYINFKTVTANVLHRIVFTAPSSIDI